MIKDDRVRASDAVRGTRPARQARGAKRARRGSTLHRTMPPAPTARSVNSRRSRQVLATVAQKALTRARLRRITA